MPWAFLVWVLCFWLQAVLVGFAFYTLIQLYDFEEDLTNNFDCAKRCNRLVVRSSCQEKATDRWQHIRAPGACCRAARPPQHAYRAAGAA